MYSVNPAVENLWRFRDVRKLNRDPGRADKRAEKKKKNQKTIRYKYVHLLVCPGFSVFRFSSLLALHALKRGFTKFAAVFPGRQLGERRV